ncbi:hypothetical protein HUG10_00855 [Halorarum halophilum]|uniref:Uncharacterized protein n=1 Tax=Halorarum halophilum TaxID=2743090 RepID=A0A7D5K5R5_9EURY|nr:hypothetical protein [Halobaculum halophilum]QLG26174.1 hypothetical protein HUG10_00855 [Halobaculum halophilum]
MSLLSRRAVLLSGLTVSVSATTGCLGGLGNSNDLDVRLYNADTVKHEARVDITGDFTGRTRSATLGSDEETLFEDLIPILDYDHQFTITVTVDGTEVSTTEHRLEEWRPYLIEVEDSETVSVTEVITQKQPD